MKNNFACMFVTVFFVLFPVIIPVMAEETMVLVSIAPADSLYTKAHDKILTEAFKILGYKYRSQYYPSKRGALEANIGRVDGDAARIYDFAKAYPNLIRVEEPYIKVEWIAYTANSKIEHITTWSDLKERGYIVGYKRGIKMCEDKLIGLIDDKKLEPITRDIQGFRKLVANRNDIYIGVPRIDMDEILGSEEFRDAGIREVGILEVRDLYVFLHKKHKAFVPGLAEAIRTVKQSNR